MNSLSYRNFFLLLFISLPLAVYNIPFGGLNFSVDRILFILSFFIIIKYPLNKTAFRFVVLLLITTLFSMIFSNIESHLFFKYFPSWFQSLIIFMLSTTLTIKYGTKFLNKIVKGHFIIILFFTMYGLWHIYVLGEIYFNYPLPSLYNDILSDSHKLSMLGNLRLFFPFSSAPRLGFVAGFIGLFYLMDPHLNNKKKYLIVTLSIIMVVSTISRGPIFALFASLFVAFFIRTLYKSKKYFLLIPPMILALVITFIFLETELEGSKYGRLLLVQGDDYSFKGHLSVRLKVLEMIFTESPINLFFGFGFGQTQQIMNVSSAHSSFFTVLFEQGLIGLISMLSIYLYSTYLALKNWLLHSNKINFRLLVLSLYLIFIHLAYDAYTMQTLWYFSGMVLGYMIIIKNQNDKK